jgi:hypothetical protein
MMLDGAEEGQLKGPIDFLAPYTSHLARRSTGSGSDGRRNHNCLLSGPDRGSGSLHLVRRRPTRKAAQTENPARATVPKG